MTFLLGMQPDESAIFTDVWANIIKEVLRIIRSQPATAQPESFLGDYFPLVTATDIEHLLVLCFFSQTERWLAPHCRSFPAETQTRGSFLRLASVSL